MAGRYLKSATRTTAPTRVIAFCTDSADGQNGAATATIPREFRAVHLIYAEYRGGKWSAGQRSTFRTVREWWDYVYGLCRRGSLLYLVSPILIDDLTLLDVWTEIDRHRIELETPAEVTVGPGGNVSGAKKGFVGRILTGNPPDVLVGMTRNGPLKGLSLKNYLDSPLRAVAERFKLPVGRKRVKGERSLLLDIDGLDGAEVTGATFRGLCDWWRAGECGPWRDTAAQLSLSLFKTRFLGERVFIHENPSASFLEREGIHGGRISAWYFGDVGPHPGDRPTREAPPEPSHYPPEPGPVWKVDVRSQYPYCMSAFPFPTVLNAVWKETTVRHLEATLKVWGAIARVRIRTKIPEYPLRTKRWTTYPTGEFVTTLAGPELIRAIHEGAVLRVYEVARYELTNCFREYANWLWERRRECRANGDHTGEEWTKLLALSFGGKLAQKPGRWVLKPGTKPRHRWGVYHVQDADNGLYRRERGIGGRRQVWDTERKGKATAPAAFAYLTAYGRLQMRELRELLSHREVYAQHTDCLFVSESGYERLTMLDKIQPDQFGGLKPDGPYTYCRFFSPAHRYVDGRWKVGGIADGFRVLKRARFKSRIGLNPHRGTMPSASGVVKQATIVRDLSGITPPSGVGPDGWAVPFHHAERTGEFPDPPPFLDGTAA